MKLEIRYLKFDILSPMLLACPSEVLYHRTKEEEDARYTRGIHMAEDTKIRDSLARDRTHLANERTFLSYIRTSLALFLGGGLIIRFDPTPFLVNLALVLIILGGILLAIGTVRFITYRQQINNDAH